MSGSFWAGSIPPWAWVLYVCAAGIFIILVLAAELHGRGVGERRAEEDREEAGAWLRELAGHSDRTTRILKPRGERTAAFLNPPGQRPETVSGSGHTIPPEVHHDEPHGPAVLDAWLAHIDLAIAIANDPANDDDFSVTAWTQEKSEMLDAWLAEHVYSVPIPYLPGEEDR